MSKTFIHRKRGEFTYNDVISNNFNSNNRVDLNISRNHVVNVNNDAEVYFRKIYEFITQISNELPYDYTAVLSSSSFKDMIYEKAVRQILNEYPIEALRDMEFSYQKSVFLNILKSTVEEELLILS